MGKGILVYAGAEQPRYLQMVLMMLPYLYVVPYREDRAATASLASWCWGGHRREKDEVGKAWGSLQKGFTFVPWAKTMPGS